MDRRRKLYLASLTLLLVAASTIQETSAAQIAAATSDKASYAPGDVATISVTIVADNESLQKVSAFARCDSSLSCPLGGQVVEGVVAQPGIPPQVILRGPTNLTLGASGNYTGQVQIGSSPPGSYKVDVTVSATSQGRVVALASSLTLTVTQASVTTGSGNSDAGVIGGVLLVAVVALVAVLVVRARRKGRTDSEDDLSEWPSLPKQSTKAVRPSPPDKR